MTNKLQRFDCSGTMCLVTGDGGDWVRLGDMLAREAALREELATAKRDVERYRALRKVTPYRFKKMQDASVTDGGDVFYFHADRFDKLMDAELANPTESGASHD